MEHLRFLSDAFSYYTQSDSATTFAGARLTPDSKHDFQWIDRCIDIAQMSGDEWEQELRWMNRVQNTAQPRKLLHR
jgi:hypothetical protein